MIQWLNINYGEIKEPIENSTLVGGSACIVPKHSLLPVSLINPSENKKTKWYFDIRR